MGMLTIFLSSSSLSVSYPSPDSSKYVIHHRLYRFDILIPGNSSMASTPELSMRRTRGLPRRDYNALHNGLVSSPSQQSEESISETGRLYSLEPSPSRDLEDTPQSKRSYSLAPRLPRLIPPFQRVEARQVVRTRIKDESPSHILVGLLSTFGPQIWITLGVGKVAHPKKTDCWFVNIAAGPPEIQCAMVPLRICWCTSRQNIVSSLGPTPSSCPRLKEASTGSWSLRDRRLVLKKC